MYSSIRFLLFCSIPDNQKPISEFILLQENSFFNWITLSKKEYKNKLKKIYFYILFFISLLFFSLVSIDFSLLYFTRIFFFVNLFFFFFFFLVFFRWYILEKRLKNSRLFYEEYSWYDGQIWEKPILLIKNERLITSQIVQPILERVSFFIFSLFFITMLTLFFILF